MRSIWMIYICICKMPAWEVLILPSLNNLLMETMALMLSRGPAGIVTGEASCLWSLEREL